MGVNFYTYGSEGKLFVPIEKWEHIEGSGGMVSPKVDTLSLRVWVSVINKALLCHSEHGFDAAFPYLKQLMDLLDKPVEASTLKEFCNKTKALSIAASDVTANARINKGVSCSGNLRQKP